MKRKVSPWEERENTQDFTGYISSLCLIVALHQTEGVGRERLERIGGAVSKIQSEFEVVKKVNGIDEAIYALQKKMLPIGPTGMHVPQIHWAKKRREQELRIASDKAATISWCCFALGIHEVLGFGRKRLQRLQHNTAENYRQFMTMYEEDPDWAFEKLRHCVQQAMNEKVTVVDTVEDKPIKVWDAQGDAAILTRQVLAAQNEQTRKKKMADLAGNVLSDMARRAAAEKISQEVFWKGEYLKC